MYVVDNATMREIDARTIASGIEGFELMERAGRGAAHALLARAPWLQGVTLVVCGRGNNGGDGYVLARHLKEAGHAVLVLRMPEDPTPDAAAHLERAREAGVEVRDLDSDDPALLLREAALQNPGRLVVDALLGTGFRPPLRAPLDALCAQVSQLGRDVVALDCPSGLSGDDGRHDEATPPARLTVAFGAPKWGLVLPRGRRVCGQLEIVDLHFPPDIVESVVADAARSAVWVDAEKVWRWLEPPAVDRHKYEAGSLVIAGGSAGMSGAVTLACHGAHRGGAGLVEALVPESEHLVIDAQAVETLVHRAPANRSGGLGRAAEERLRELGARRDAVVFGCGLGRDDELDAWVPAWLASCERPLVIDADALTVLARAETRPALGEDTILTPHGGEFERLTGLSPQSVAEDRPRHVVEAAQEWGAVILHKGAPTYVAAPDGRLAVVGAGGPGLATAGSGDVLAGLCGAFLAAGHEAFVAAALAAWVHGAAGDRVEALRGIRGTVASDLPPAVALVLREIESLPQ